jgi:hypothetical protein
MQGTDLLAKHPPDNEQRFDQHDQVGNILDQLLDACFNDFSKKARWYQGRKIAELAKKLFG